MQIRREVLAVLLAAMVSAGCAGGGDDAAPPTSSTVVTPPVPYTVTITASSGNDVVTVDGTTNFPDGTTVSLSGKLATRDQDASELGFPSVGTGAAVVSAGGFRGNFRFDPSDLLAIAESNYANRGAFKPIEEIDEDVTVCATVSTGKDLKGGWVQPDSVRKVLGDFGEGLRASPGAEQLGTALPGGPAWTLTAKAVSRYPAADVAQRIRETQYHPVKVKPLEASC